MMNTELGEKMVLTKMHCSMYKVCANIFVMSDDDKLQLKFQRVE